MATFTPSRRAASSLSSILATSTMVACATDIDLINIYNPRPPACTLESTDRPAPRRRPRGGPMATAVRELMSTPPVTCPAEASLSEAAR